MKKITITAFLSLISTAVFANDSRFSAEILIGKTDLEFVSNEYFDVGDDTALGIRGVYNLNQNVAFELSYINHGKTNDNSSDAFGDTFTDKISSSAFNFAVKGSIPFELGFSISARLGLAFWDIELSETDSYYPGEVFKGRDSGNDLYYGIGTQYLINEKFTIGAEYTVAEYGFKPGGDFSAANDTELDIKTFALTAGLKF